MPPRGKLRFSIFLLAAYTPPLRIAMIAYPACTFLQASFPDRTLQIV